MNNIYLDRFASSFNYGRTPIGQAVMRLQAANFVKESSPVTMLGCAILCEVINKRNNMYCKLVALSRCFKSKPKLLSPKTPSPKPKLFYVKEKLNVHLPVSFQIKQGNKRLTLRETFSNKNFKLKAEFPRDMRLIDSYFEMSGDGCLAPARGKRWPSTLDADAVVANITPHTTIKEFEALRKILPDYNLEDCASLNLHHGVTVIHKAIYENNLSLTKYLIKVLNNKNIRNTLSDSPLSFAILQRVTLKRNNPINLKIIETLLPHCDVNITGSSYALKEVLDLKETKLVHMFLKYGARKSKSLKGNVLTSEKFTEEQEKLYQSQKISQATRTLFMCAKSDPRSCISGLPKEVILQIVAAGRVFSTYHIKILELKKKLREQQPLKV